MSIRYCNQIQIYLLNYKYLIISICLALIAFYFYYNYGTSTSSLPLIYFSQQCISKKLRDIPPEAFEKQWLSLNESINNCTINLFQKLKIEKFPNSDEVKLGILPKNLNDKCNVLTLGIGKDVGAEKELLKKLPHCKFIGVDPDAKESGKLFTEVTKGKFIEGVVGVTNGVYNSTILKNDFYMPELLLHHSLEELISRNFMGNKIIDYLFMDIEGDEFALMEDLINNHNKYPTICQINVEFHDPHKNERGKRFFQNLFQSLQDSLYLPFKVERELIYSFNRIFFINMNEICINKFY